MIVTANESAALEMTALKPPPSNTLKNVRHAYAARSSHYMRAGDATRQRGLFNKARSSAGGRSVNVAAEVPLSKSSSRSREKCGGTTASLAAVITMRYLHKISTIKHPSTDSIKYFITM